MKRQTKKQNRKKLRNKKAAKSKTEETKRTTSSNIVETYPDPFAACGLLLEQRRRASRETLLEGR